MTLRILNLGAGVQSTTVFLMAHEGLIDPIDHAIFADTQEEPEAVYQHLAWLRTVPAPVPLLHVATAGKLGDDLMHGINADGRQKRRPGRDGSTRFASIPAYTAVHHSKRDRRTGCNEGMTRRQCTKEYKVEVVEQIIRRVILGLRPRQRVPRGQRVVQAFGISWDERGRADRISNRFAETHWAQPSFPLIEKRMTRDDCREFLRTRVPHTVPRSACVFCPFKRASEWLETKANPKEWARAVQIDRGIRELEAAEASGLRQSLYLHRSCLPLDEIDFDKEAAKEAAKKATPMFALMDCGEGMCGV